MPRDRLRRDRSSSSDSSEGHYDCTCNMQQNDEEDEQRVPPKGQKANYIHGTSFFNFLSDYRAQHRNANLTPVQLAVNAGEAWRSLSASQREPYAVAAAAVRKKRGKAKPRKNAHARALEAAKKAVQAKRRKN